MTAPALSPNATALDLACPTCQAAATWPCVNTRDGSPHPDGYFHPARWVTAQPDGEPATLRNPEYAVLAMTRAQYVHETRTDDDLPAADAPAGYEARTEWEPITETVISRHCMRTLAAAQGDETFGEEVKVGLACDQIADLAADRVYTDGHHVTLFGSASLTARNARCIAVALLRAAEELGQLDAGTVLS